MLAKHTAADDLRDWMERACWSQSQVAEYLGVSRPQVSHLVNGTRSPSLRLATRIQRMTGIPVKAWTNRVQKVVA